MPLWSSPECSPPCHGGDRGFKSRRGRSCSTIRKPAKRRSSNLRDRLWVRLPPVLLAGTIRVGWALASLGGRNPLASGCAGSTPARRTGESRGPAATTPGLHPGNEGSSPSGTCQILVRISTVKHRPAIDRHLRHYCGFLRGPCGRLLHRFLHRYCTAFCTALNRTLEIGIGHLQIVLLGNQSLVP